ncbi:MAG: hypothetical protein IJQ93_14200 [Bacteroidales bacterium]|nr:hypothetical protein [Bacteroidales bacterium]
MRLKPIITCILAVILCCCESGHKIILPDDYSHVYTKDGRSDDFRPDKSKNKFILYFSQKGLMKPCLSELWTSSADSVFKANPDWEFIIYYKGSLADSLDLRSLLEKYNCGAYIVISENDEFKKDNGIGKILQTSYFLDSNNKVLGQWLVGDDSFEKQFNDINNIIR